MKLKEEREAIAEEIIQKHRLPDVADSSILYFEPDRDEIKQDIIDALLSHEEKVVASLVERVAKAIYDQMSYTENGVKPAWVEKGNSLKQEEARRIARNILTLPITDEKHEDNAI